MRRSRWKKLRRTRWKKVRRTRWKKLRRNLVWWLVPTAALALVAVAYLIGRSPSGDDSPVEKAQGGSTTTTEVSYDSASTCQARDLFIFVSAGVTADRDAGALVQALDELSSVLQVLESDPAHGQLAAHVAVLRPAVDEGRRLADAASSPEEIAALARHPGLAAPEVLEASAAIANYPLRCTPAA